MCNSLAGSMQEEVLLSGKHFRLRLQVDITRDWDWKMLTVTFLLVDPKNSLCEVTDRGLARLTDLHCL